MEYCLYEISSEISILSIQFHIRPRAASLLKPDFHTSARKMDRIAPLGRGIADIVGPSFQIYGDLLRKPSNALAIHATKHQKLDLYTPSSRAPKVAAGERRPIFVFAYGGGFVSGDRIIDMIPGKVVYTNLGYFFAEKLGFETIVMDYRLLQHGAKYPSGGEDVGDMMNWVETRYGSTATGFTGKREIFLLGNSAGAVHVSTWLFESRFSESRKIFVEGTNGIRLSRVVFLGCPFRWDMKGGMREMLSTYYGGEKEIKEAEPTALMEGATKEPSARGMSKWPSLLVAVSELDPEDQMVLPGKEFAMLWRDRGGKGKFLELKGHNHLSPPLSLGTGIEREEAWGFEVAKWMTEKND
jgi:hypothetical protein